MSELRALTSARGIAAWLVVLYHIRASIAGLPHGVEAVFAKGYLAVDFFFLLSVPLKWQKEKVLRNLPSRLARKFLSPVGARN